MLTCRLPRAALFCLLLIPLGLPAWAQNRVKDGGMEDLTAASQFQLAQTTGEWWLNPAYPARVTAVDDARLAHSGKLCLRVVPLDRTVGENGQPPREGAVSQGIGALQPGEKYFIRFFARGLGNVAAYVYQYDKNGWQGSTASPGQQLSSNWREYRWYYTVPAGVTNGALAFHVAPGGLMYLDDVSFAPVAAFPAPPAIGEGTFNGNPVYVLENPLVKIAIDPKRGAQVVSVVRKADGQELIPDGAKTGGLFSDHDVSQPWPGEYMNAPYSAAKVDLQDGSAAVRFTYTTSTAKATQMAGLRLEKTISLFPDAPAIRCDMAFTNPTKEGRAVQYWMQNFVTAAGDPTKDTFLRPSAEGLSPVGAQAAQPEFVHDPTAGWTAVSGPQGSVVFTMDYDSLDTLYNCGPGKAQATTEWMLSKVAIPAGKTWETTVWCLVTPLAWVGTASPDLVAGTLVGSGGTGGSSSHPGGGLGGWVELAAATRLLGTVQVTTDLLKITSRYDTPTGKTVEVAEPLQMPGWPLAGQLTPVGYQSAKLNLPGADLKEDTLCLLRTKISGDALAIQYEVPFPVGQPEAQATLPEYSLAPPPKFVLRFEPEKLAIDRTGKLRVLLIRDAGVPAIGARWKLEEVLKGMPGPPEVTVSEHSFIDWKQAGQLTFFPALMEDLLKFQVIILEAPDAAALSPSEQEMLRDYLKAGGGMLVLGGYYSYGKGRWEGTGLGDLMPVKPKSPWDFVQVTAPITVAAQHPALAGVDFGGGPRVIWLQEVDPAPGAQVLLTAGGKPLLVASGGPGKVLCFTGTVLGYEDKAGGTPFWLWDKYPAFLQALISWLGSEK